MTVDTEQQRSPSASERRDEWGLGALAIIAAGMVAYAAIVFSTVTYVPLWDGYIYANCFLDAAERLSVAALGCADHTTHGYVLWVALAARLAPGGSSGVVPMLAVNVLLGLVALAALARLLGHVLPGRQWATERALACAAFAVQPLFIVSTLQPNVDFGILVFALPCACALLERRVLTAAVFGCLVVFSKEPGIAVYAVLVLAVLLPVVKRPTDTWREARKRCRPFVALIVPLVLAGAYLGVRTIGRVDVDAILAGGSGLTSVPEVAGPLVDPVVINYLLGIFVLNFLWVPTGVMAIDLCAAVMGRLRKAADWASAARPAPERAIAYTALVLTVILTRYKTFSNFRYLLVLYPLFLVLFVPALTRRVPWRSVRLGVLGGVILLFGLSNFRTIDPVSKAAFGTWPFGSHDLLDMTVNTRECCGHGRDQLVYNLEFTHVAALEDAALAAIRPRADTPLVMDEAANWYTIGRIDPATFRRTLRRAGTFESRALDLGDLAKLPSLPDAIVYFAFENVENQQSLAWLADRYTVSDVLTFDDKGYRLRVYRMTRRTA